MSKARGLADLGNVYNDGALSNRNLIINGAFNVAQRGTSFTTNGYHLDRWRTYNSGGTATISQQASASGSSPEVGLDTYVRIVRASPSGIFYLNQRVEDVRKSDGATLTLSFYGKASSPTTVPCRIPQEFGTGGSAGVGNAAQDNNLTTSWQKFSMTFNMASLSGKTIGTGSYFDPVFDIPATTATIEITGVQLEVGDTATPFEHRSYGQELSLCQRYYEKSFQQGQAPIRAIAAPDRFGGTAYGPSSLGESRPFSVSKRNSPTMTYYHGVATGVSASGTINAYISGSWSEVTISGGGAVQTAFTFDCTGLTLTTGYSYLLDFNWTADAEL